MEMEEWHDQIPNAPDLGDAAATERKPPYSIIVSILIPLSFFSSISMLNAVFRARCRWLVWVRFPGGNWRFFIFKSH